MGRGTKVTAAGEGQTSLDTQAEAPVRRSKRARVTTPPAETPVEAQPLAEMTAVTVDTPAEEASTPVETPAEGEAEIPTPAETPVETPAEIPSAPPEPAVPGRGPEPPRAPEAPARPPRPMSPPVAARPPGPRQAAEVPTYSTAFDRTELERILLVPKSKNSVPTLVRFRERDAPALRSVLIDIGEPMLRAGWEYYRATNVEPDPSEYLRMVYEITGLKVPRLYRVLAELELK